MLFFAEELEGHLRLKSKELYSISIDIISYINLTVKYHLYIKLCVE